MSDRLGLWMLANGYHAARELPDGRVAAVTRLLYGTWRLLIGTYDWVDDAY